MHGRTYYLETFGCQMNILDSELVEGQLRARGMRAVADAAAADLILFNTCSVRQHAEDKVLSRLGELRRHKRRRPGTIIGVIGCMAEREKEGLFVKSPQVDLLCGPGELNRLTALVEEVWQRHERVAALAGSASRRTDVLKRALEYDGLEALDLSRAAAPGAGVLQSYIRVQRGCDQFCTFCVVPFTRGPERSRPPQHIVDEARLLAQAGCREVTLLGQTVNSYVHQEDGRAVPFARLLERVHAVDGIDRIRFVTSFPADWDPTIFDVMRDCPRIMPYLHIPPQSGSDAVLKRMKRGYTASAYLRLIDAARARVPEVALAGDVIVGFCGETEDDFRRTVELVRAVEFSNLYVFKYSPRPGTKADRNFADDVPDDVKAARCRELLAVQDGIGRRLRERLVGRSVEVLVEGFSRQTRRARGERSSRLRTRGRDGLGAYVRQSEQDRGAEALRHAPPVRAGAAGLPQLVGRTPQDMVVVFDGPGEIVGALARVRVEEATSHTLSGRLLDVVSPPRAATGAGDGSARPRGIPLPLAQPNAGPIGVLEGSRVEA